MKIRDNTMSFPKRKVRDAFKRETEISSNWKTSVIKKCNGDNLSNIDSILNEYETLKKEIQSMYKEKGRAAIFRSELRWVEKGERPSKYC